MTAGGFRDGGQLLGIQSRMQLIPVDLDGAPSAVPTPTASMCTPAFWAIVAAPSPRRSLPPWSSPSENSTMVAEPQYPMSGSSPSSPILTDVPVIALSEPRIAEASEVPPESAGSAPQPRRGAIRLGADVVSAPWSNPTTPMSTLSGWASMNAGRPAGRPPAGSERRRRHSCCWTRPSPG